MATTLYLLNGVTGTKPASISRGDKTAGQAGSAAWWIGSGLDTSYPSEIGAVTAATVAGPTSGIEPLTGGISCEWISLPLAAAVTISGTLSFQLYGYESDMKANAALACRIDKVSGVDYSLTTIYTGADDAELSSSLYSAMTWTGTPTSTAFAKGDRIRIVPYFDDGGGDMGSGYSASVAYSASTRESYVTFNENLTFMTFSGAQYIYPTNTASDLSTADVDYKAWTSRGT